MAAKGNHSASPKPKVSFRPVHTLQLQENGLSPNMDTLSKRSAQYQHLHQHHHYHHSSLTETKIKVERIKSRTSEAAPVLDEQRPGHHHVSHPKKRDGGKYS